MCRTDTMSLSTIIRSTQKEGHLTPNRGLQSQFPFLVSHFQELLFEHSLHVKDIVTKLESIVMATLLSTPPPVHIFYSIYWPRNLVLTFMA